MKKKVWKWIQWIIAIYLIGGMALYLLQDYILFHPVTLKRDREYSIEQPHQEIEIAMNQEDTLHLVRFLSTPSIKKGIVLYFHGNRKNISWYARHMPAFTRNGYDVMMIDYPGFGKSKGKLTEEKLYDWAHEVYKMAIANVPADSIIIYGKSMGTGIAAELASARDCKRLILETPYYDFPAVVQHYLPVYPVRWLLHYQLPTYRYIRNVTAPVTIFHGTKDQVVPYRNSMRLKNYLKTNDEIITVKGGRHNNLFKYKQVITHLDSILAL